MAFENITKGEFDVIDDSTYPLHGIWSKSDDGFPTYVARTCYAPSSKENAEFIAYCFNLQQRFDISKLEETIELLEESNRQIEYMQQKFKPTGTGNSVLSRINSLLTQIKK